MCTQCWCQCAYLLLSISNANVELAGGGICLQPTVLYKSVLVCFFGCAPMGTPSHGGDVSHLSLPTPFSPIFVCHYAYRNLLPILLFTHQLLPIYLQFSCSDCPLCFHRPFTYISLFCMSSFCYFSFSLVANDTVKKNCSERF